MSSSLYLLCSFQPITFLSDTASFLAKQRVARVRHLLVCAIPFGGSFTAIPSRSRRKRISLSTCVPGARPPGACATVISFK